MECLERRELLAYASNTRQSVHVQVLAALRTVLTAATVSLSGATRVDSLREGFFRSTWILSSCSEQKSAKDAAWPILPFAIPGLESALPKQIHARVKVLRPMFVNGEAKVLKPAEDTVRGRRRMNWFLRAPHVSNGFLNLRDGPEEPPIEIVFAQNIQFCGKDLQQVACGSGELSVSSKVTGDVPNSFFDT